MARQGAVSAELRQRIRAAAQRLGYTPNLAARSLAGKGSGLIGVLVNSLADPLIGTALTALAHRFAEAGYALVVCMAEESPGKGLAALRELLARGPEGLVLVESAEGLTLANALRGRAAPWVAIAEDAGAPRTLALGRRRGAALACRYLLEQGHRRIGVIAPVGGGAAAGVAEALAGANALALSEGLLQPQDPEGPQAAMRRLLARDAPPTAVVCGSDLYAIAALRECLGRGIEVPRSVSIVGFGDAEFARRTSPALTTVRIAAAELGARLAQGLLDVLEDGNAAPIFETPLKLVVRESTGALQR